MDSEGAGRPPETFLVLGVVSFTATCFVICMCCCADWANRRMNRRRAAMPNTHQPEQFLPSASKGLDHSQIRSIPVCFYRATDDAIQGSDCAICLGKFGDGEQLRLLPKCAHAFHVPCIDTWLQLNSNCPLCRSQILENGHAVVILPHVSAAPEMLQDFCPQFTDINQDQAAQPVFSPRFSLPRLSTEDHLILIHKLFRYKSMPCSRATSASNGPASLAADLV